VLFGRTEKREKAIVVIENIEISLYVNITKPVLMGLFESEELVIGKIIEDNKNILVKSDHVFKKMKPFHEYSSFPHTYFRLKFNDLSLMQNFIDKFNNNKTNETINCTNSYLSDDEIRSSFDIKLCREFGYSLVDWNYINFYRHKIVDNVIIYFLA